MYDIKNKNYIDSWNNRLQEYLDKHDYSQAFFANKLNEFCNYQTNFTQATVNNWLNVGIDRSGRKIGMPKYENMVLIAECLNVNVGYLTGETDMETFTNEKICEHIHLNENSVKTIIKITGSERSCLEWGHQSEKYQRILNNLLASRYFLDFINELSHLYDIYNSRDKINEPLNKIKKEFENESFDYALKIINENNYDEDIPEKTCEIVRSIEKAIDDEYTLEQNYKYNLKLYRFTAIEAVIRLINDLYPNQE